MIVGSSDRELRVWQLSGSEEESERATIGQKRGPPTDVTAEEESERNVSKLPWLNTWLLLYIVLATGSYSHLMLEQLNFKRLFSSSIVAPLPPLKCGV